MIGIRFTLSVLFFLLSIPILAQPPVLLLKNYLVNDGLPSAQVYEIVEDHDGYVWFGTDAGLVRYNGYEFKTYTMQDGLSSNVVFKINVDEENRVWCIGKDWRINYFSKGRFFTLPDVLGFSPNNPNVGKDLLSLAITSNRLLLNISLSNFYGNALENHIPATLELNHQGIVSESAKLPGIYIYDDTLGCRISMQSDSDMVVYYNGQLVTETPLYVRKRRIDFANVIKLEDQLYFTADGKVFTLKGDSLKLQIEEVWSGEAAIKDLKKDRDNNLYLATGSGVCKISDGDWGQEKWLLEDLSVSNILIDRNNGLWVGSLYKGLFHCFDQRVQCIYSPSNVSVNEIQGTADRIYFINENSELFGIQRDIVYHIPQAEKPKLFYRGMMDLYYSSHSTFFKTHSGSQPVILDLEKEEWTKILLYPHTFYITDSGMVANNTYRIERINRKGKQIEIADFDQEIYKMGPMRDSFRILSTEAGMVKFIHQEEKVAGSVKYMVEVDSLAPYRPQNTFFQSRISDIVQFDASTTIFSSTQKGCLIESTDGEDIHFNKESGLISNSIQKLYANEGYLVCISREGITVVSDQYAIRNYDKHNGLLSNDVRDVFVRNDSIWVATDLGISNFPLQDLSLEKVKPLYLREIEANLHPIEANDAKLELAYWQRNLALSFELVEYEQEGKIIYSYMLEGLDQHWETTTSRTVRYPNLPAGNFDFWVKVKYANKLWSEPIQLLHIHKPLVIWKRNWFLMLLGAFALALIYMSVLFFFRRKNRMQRDKMNLLSLERKNLQAQMNPHFTYNTINSIQHYILNNDKKEAILYLSEFAKLMRKTLDFNYTEFISIQEELAFLNAYLALENKRFGESFFLEVEADQALDLSTIYIPSLLIQPLIENVIVHGNYAVGQERSIKIKIIDKPKHYVIQVIDYGKGIQLDKKPRKYRARGLSIVKGRIRIYNSKQHTAADFRSFFTHPTERTGNTTQIRLLKHENHNYR